MQIRASWFSRGWNMRDGTPRIAHGLSALESSLKVCLNLCVLYRLKFEQRITRSIWNRQYVTYIHYLAKCSTFLMYWNFLVILYWWLATTTAIIPAEWYDFHDWTPYLFHTGNGGRHLENPLLFYIIDIMLSALAKYGYRRLLVIGSSIDILLNSNLIDRGINKYLSFALPLNFFLHKIDIKSIHQKWIVFLGLIVRTRVLYILDCFFSMN